jgi:hypothetical protein
MGLLAEELRAGIDEAARKMTEARLAGDDYGAETYRERLEFLCRVAGRHGLGPCPEPTAGGEAGRDCCQAASP